MCRETIRRYGAAGRFGAAVAALALGFGLAGCSSSSKSSSPPPTTTSAAPTTPAFDRAAAKSEVVKNWEAFFSKTTPIAQKQALLQHGSQMGPTVQAFASDPRVGQVSSTVTDVTFTDSSNATVTYTISLNGQLVLPSATGKAVSEDGTWKVSDATLCSLLTLTGTAHIPGCA